MILKWFGIDLIQLHRAMGHMMKTRLPLDDETNLKRALAEWKRDVRADADRMNNTTYPPGPDELLHILRRGIRWFWFWGHRWPDPIRRQQFAIEAAEREAALEALAAKTAKKELMN
jgi:hypothetical protein